MPQTSLQTLQHLGLTDKEARVYTASLELGSAPVQIIALKADINRPTAYVVIDNLLKMGLMTRHEAGKKTLYAAEPPERLERLIERQHESLVEREAELKSIFPELKAIFNLSENKPRVKFYEGREGYRAMLAEYYKPAFRGKTLYAFTPHDLVEEAMGSDQLTEWADRRVSFGIHLNVIYSTSKESIPDFTDPRRLREARYLPRTHLPFQAMVSILPDWGFWMFSFKKGFVGLAVQNPELAHTLKTIFDLAWESSFPIDKFKGKRKPATSRLKPTLSKLRVQSVK